MNVTAQRDTLLALRALLMGADGASIVTPNHDTPQDEIRLVETLRGVTPADRVRALMEQVGPAQGAALMAAAMALDAPSERREYPLTEAGNAEMLADLFGHKLRYSHKTGRWLIFDGVRWRPDDTEQAKRLALTVARQRQARALKMDNQDQRARALKWALGSESNKKLENVLRLARAIPPIADNGDWDAQPWILGVRNGVVDLTSGQLRPGAPEYRITRIAGAAYNPQAEAPRWERFLHEIFGGDDDLVDFIHRAIGYSVVGEPREQVLFLCHGTGANGKSTMLGVLRRVLGGYAANTPFSTFEAQYNNQNTNDLAALYGARFVTASETNEASRLNEARVKAVTGGDPVTARFLHREFFTFVPTFVIWLAMNHLPAVRGTDDGIWRRIRLVPFNQSFLGKEDRDLEKKLLAESEGILAWVVRGALEYRRRGLEAPESVRRATEKYRSDSDAIKMFLDERVEFRPDASVKAGVLYREYVKWAESYNIRPVSIQTFGRRMTAIGYPSQKMAGMKLYPGIGLPAKEVFFDDD